MVVRTTIQVDAPREVIDALADEYDSDDELASALANQSETVEYELRPSEWSARID